MLPQRRPAQPLYMPPDTRGYLCPDGEQRTEAFRRVVEQAFAFLLQSAEATEQAAWKISVERDLVRHSQETVRHFDAASFSQQMVTDITLQTPNGPRRLYAVDTQEGKSLSKSLLLQYDGTTVNLLDYAGLDEVYQVKVVADYIRELEKKVHQLQYPEEITLLQGLLGGIVAPFLLLTPVLLLAFVLESAVGIDPFWSMMGVLCLIVIAGLVFSMRTLRKERRQRSDKTQVADTDGPTLN